MISINIGCTTTRSLESNEVQATEAETYFTQASTYYDQKNYSKALELYRKSAELGDTFAMINIGFMYQTGEGVQQDYTKALHWYTKCRDKGEPECLTRIGVIHEHGLGIPKDLPKAIQLYKKSASLGSGFGMFKLAICNHAAFGMNEDLSMAKYWYEKSIENDYIDGKNNLAELYELGISPDKTIEDAFELYKSASADGNSLSMYHVGRHYQYGLGNTPKNMDKALEWYKKSVSVDHDNLAVHALAEIDIATGNIEIGVKALLGIEKTAHANTDIDSRTTAYDKAQKTLTKLLADTIITNKELRQKVQIRLKSTD